MNASVYGNFMEALIVMVKGMGGIFVVLFAIYLSIKFLIRVFPEK
jgi:Na+-transporting methylmalonyl-CoA/oxaloacetate decarboxylase gamma subunit